MFSRKADIDDHTLFVVIGPEFGGLNFVSVQPGPNLIHGPTKIVPFNTND